MEGTIFFNLDHEERSRGSEDKSGTSQRRSEVSSRGGRSLKSCFTMKHYALLALLLHCVTVCPHAPPVAVSRREQGFSCISTAAARRVMRLTGGSSGGVPGGDDPSDTACEGPARRFREFEAPEDATSTEGFLRAAEAREASMDHAEFQRYSDTIKDGTDGPWAKELEETMRAFEEDEHKRMSSVPQVLGPRL